MLPMPAFRAYFRRALSTVWGAAGKACRSIALVIPREGSGRLSFTEDTHSLSGVTAETVVSQPPPVVLSIAGFDPSSGAGVTADLQTFTAHGIFGTCAVTALTVQSTRGVRRVQVVEGRLLQETLECLEEDLPPAGVKIGMLGSAELVDVVAQYVKAVRAKRPVYVVLDPVLRSSSGAALLEEEGIFSMCQVLLPLCDCATPNRGELALLTGQRAVSDVSHFDDDVVLDRARDLQTQIGGREIVVTGGDETGMPTDLLLTPEGRVFSLEGQRVETSATHGTGCAFSSALLCRRLLGSDLTTAAHGAKAYVEGALRAAPGLGAGHGPMNLLWTRPLQARAAVEIAKTIR